MANPDFDKIIVQLFSTLRLPHEAMTSPNPGYTVRIEGKLLIELIGLQQGFINLRSIVGTVPDNIDSGSLLHMLYANQFAFEHPPVSIGVDPDTAAITVWSRQALSELHGDIACLWFERFTTIASFVHRWLDAKPRSPSRSRSPAPTQERMRRALGSGNSN